MSRYEKLRRAVLFAFVCLLAISCSTTLQTSKVAYQSVRTKYAQPETIPDDAKIVVVYSIDEYGKLTAVVFNRTSEIMIIDQTMSFLTNTNGVSVSYYDPTVRATTQTNMSSSTAGSSVNLGAVAGFLGIGGPLGGLLGGISVGGSDTTGSSLSNTVYSADMPQISLAPRSQIAMSKAFPIIGLGKSSLRSGNSVMMSSVSEIYSPRKFSVCISYSLDGGATYEKLITDFYESAEMIVSVKNHGYVNEALREIYAAKQDALAEPWWMLYFVHNITPSKIDREAEEAFFNEGEIPAKTGSVSAKKKVFDSMQQGLMYDFQ